MKIDLPKDKVYILAGIVALLVIGFVYYQFFMPNNNNIHEPSYSVPMAVIYTYEETNEAPVYDIGVVGEVTVFISGEVNGSGVFTLPENSRIIDALDKAGGPTTYADLNRINLASFLVDAQHIIVPSIYDELIEESLAVNSSVNSGLININSASLAELQTLPGIGPVLAGNIITHRNENGQFSSIAEIQNVPRIGAGIFANIASLITVY